MNQTVLCPHCRHPVVHRPEMSGWPVFCPSCRGPFQMPSQPPSAADPFELSGAPTRGAQLREQHSQVRYAWLAVAALVAIVTAYLGISFALYRGVRGARLQADVEGIAWTNEQLRTFLERDRKLRFTTVLYEQDAAAIPAIELEFVAEQNDTRRVFSVRIYQHENAAAAERDVRERRLQAGAERQLGVFWGRFAFFGDPYAVEEVVRAVER